MKTQAERMIKMETDLKNIDDKLDAHSIDQREDFDKILDKLNKLEDLYAGKWVEKLTIGILIGFITILLGGII